MIKTNKPYLVKYILILATVSFLSGCQEKAIEQPLRITSVKTISAKEIDSEKLYKYDSLTQAILQNDTFFKLFDDGTYTLLSKSGNYLTDKYSLSGDELVLNLGNIGKFNFTIEEEVNPNTEAKIVVLRGRNNQKYEIRMLLSIDDERQFEEIDLLTPEANWWRNKPSSSETESEISNRLLAHLDYMIGYFNIVEKKKLRAFETAHLQSPFRFYRNGIGVQNQNRHAYTDVFYDEKDAEIARTMLVEGLNSIGVYPADDESYAVGYKNAILIIRQHVEAAAKMSN